MALTAIGAALIAYGILIGSIHEIHKYGHEMVSRVSNPLAFWIAVAYHTFVVLFLAYITYTCLCAAGWVARQRAVDTIAEYIGTFLNPQRRAPAFVIVVVLGAFFFMLAYIARRWS
ncbi:MAG: hypothetical protein Q7J42_17630 [Sulfuritalea sp.]|nr:hypothetical protein [Sulfuritalea sp.]